MTTSSAARLMRLKDYGIAVGGPADLVVLDAPDPVMALRTVAPVLAAYKRGRRTVTREPVRLHRPYKKRPLPMRSVGRAVSYADGVMSPWQ